ncbi:MAG TPA: sensor histidine kinase N-terminal domain-containing protein [Rhodocyclaceae bacterium]
MRLPRMPERGRLWLLRFAFDSLLGEVLLWIFSLLLFLWALSVIMTYQVANSLANKPYDEQLANDVRAVARLVTFEHNRISVISPTVAREMLRADARDHVYYQVTGPDGRLIAGDMEIPSPELTEFPDLGAVRFRDDEIATEDVRVAYVFLAAPAPSQTILVQVAETRQKRESLAGSIVSGVIVPQFVIVPLAVLFVYLGLARGITPLQRLQRELGRRRPADLSPVSVEGIPEEIRPLIESMNGVMKRLEDNLGAQRRFIADAAHQIKTPLTGLRSQTELALLETDPEQMKKALRNVAVGAERLSHLTRQLLSLARAEASSERASGFAHIDLREVARSAAMEWADRALAKSIDLGYEEPAWAMEIVGSEFLLSEMLGNLLDNAVKYTPPGGQVTLRVYAADEEDAECRIEVEDSGIGIPEAEREQVFERFYRASSVEGEGSGLGLAIVKEVLELHGGWISLEASTNGHGTRVCLALPRVLYDGWEGE